MSGFKLRVMSPAAALGALAALAALGALVAVATPAIALETDALETDGSNEIKEIIVTARKTNESLQRVPVAITVLTPEALTQANIKEAVDIHLLTPGLFTEQGELDSSSIYFNIRGQQSASGFAESSVGVYVDGVYRQSQYGLNGALFDLERVEVLKGPQGTLYGKNTSGGVVNFISKKPDLENFGGYVTASGGAYASTEADARGNPAGRIEAALNAPLIDGKLALRVSSTYLRSDGYGTDANGRNLNTQNDPYIRAQLLFKPGDNWQYLLSADWAKYDSSGMIRRISEVHPGPLALAIGVNAGYFGLADLPSPANPTGTRAFQTGLPAAIGLLSRDLTDGLFYHSNGTSEYGSWLNNSGASLTIDGDLGQAAHLKSISAYRYLNNRNFNDSDGTSYNQFLSSFANDSTFWSQEFDLSGRLFNDKFEWLSGGFWSNYDSLNGGVPGFGIQALTALTGTSILYDSEEVSRSLGFFAHGVYHVTDALSVTAGVRWSQDSRHVTPMDKSYSANATVLLGCLPVTGPGGALLTGATLANGCVYPTQYLSDSGVSYEAAVNYQFTPSLMAYVTTRRGFRSGDFNTNGGYAPYQPEIATDYEIGLKSTFFDRTLLFNIAGYLTDYSNVQRSQTVISLAGNAIGTAVQNAAKAQIYGVELETRYQPVKNLELGANYTYTDPKYIKWLEPTATPGVYINHNQDEWEVPLQMFNLSATYTADLASGDKLVLHGGVYHQSLLFFGGDLQLLPSETILKQNAYALTDGRISYEFTAANASVALFGRNLMDKKYYIGAAALRPVGISGLIPGEPRFIGIEVTKHFGK
jgi:iron complex outermembrane recepter protein